MDTKDARAFIEQNFNEKIYTDDSWTKFTEDNFITVLNSIYKLVPFKSIKQNQNLCRFLWAGCRRFNRWFAPSPYVVLDGNRINYNKFVTTLSKTEYPSTENASIFQLHMIRDAIYSEFNSIPLPIHANYSGKIQEIRQQMYRIRGPKNPVKLTELTKELSTIKDILDNIENGNLQTICSFKLPYPIVSKKINISSKFKNVTLSCELTPTFIRPAGFIQIHEPAVACSRTPTRWQFGSTDIYCKFSALIDPSCEVAPLQLPMMDMLSDKWPNLFRFIYEMTYEVCHDLRGNPTALNTWIPSPADIGDIEYFMRTTKQDQINYMHMSNPSSVLRCFIPSTGEELVNIESLEATPWHKKCRILAQQFLENGDSRESLFWLNIGIESLLNLRISSILDRNGSDKKHENLKFSSDYWDEAKKIIEKQAPEISSKITWPETKTYASMFKRLKRIYKLCEISISKEECLGHYSKISKHRNNLFHGENENPISPEAVIIAINSYDYLEQKFV